MIMVMSPIFCEIFLRWRVMPRSMLIIKAKSPPTKLGSSQVETRRFRCGSQPSSSSDAMSGKTPSWMNPAMARRSAEIVRRVIMVLGVGGVAFKVANLGGVRIWWVARKRRVYSVNLIR